MGREEFMKRIDARKDRVVYEPTSYPFGAEELLLNQELRQLEEDKKERTEK